MRLPAAVCDGSEIFRGPAMRMFVAFMVASCLATASAAHARDVVPDQLRYLFELPWCKQWNFNCNKCEKKEGEVVCTRNNWLPPDRCTEDFSSRYCTAWSAPIECARWSDGCNVCQRAPKRSALNCHGPDDLCQKLRDGGHWSCTLMSCDEYRADRPPRFTCLKTADPSESR
jgi:hypothetical protein